MGKPKYYCRGEGYVPRHFIKPVAQSDLQKILEALDLGWRFETACSWQGHEPKNIMEALRRHIKN